MSNPYPNPIHIYRGWCDPAAGVKASIRLFVCLVVFSSALFLYLLLTSCRIKFNRMVNNSLSYLKPSQQQLCAATVAMKVFGLCMKRAHKLGFSKVVITFNELLMKSCLSLFQKCSHRHTL